MAGRDTRPSVPVELTCTATRGIASGELYAEAPPSLGDLLFAPERADWYHLDGGAGEADLSDTPFAEDRRYGYELTIDQREDADLGIDFDDVVDEAAYEAALAEPVTLTARGRLQVTDLTVVHDYAAFRRVLRIGVSEGRPATPDEALHELLVAGQQQPIDGVVDFQVIVTSADD